MEKHSEYSDLKLLNLSQSKKIYTDNTENDSDILKKSKKIFYENICKERILIYG